MLDPPSRKRREHEAAPTRVSTASVIVPATDLTDLEMVGSKTQSLWATLITDMRYHRSLRSALRHCSLLRVATASASLKRRLFVDLLFRESSDLRLPKLEPKPTSAASPSDTYEGQLTDRLLGV